MSSISANQQRFNEGLLNLLEQNTINTQKFINEMRAKKEKKEEKESDTQSTLETTTTTTVTVQKKPVQKYKKRMLIIHPKQ